MINEEKTKVLFAEADSDFADVLLSFLTLPLGTIIRVMNKHYQDKAPPVIGSLTSLYKGLGNLNKAYFWSEGGKQMLLNPRSSFEPECRKLKLNVDDTQPISYYRCGDKDCNRERTPSISMYHDTVKCDCVLGSKPETENENNIDGGVFTKKHVSFLITDDLRVAPVVPGSIMQTLIKLGNIAVTCGAELRTVTLGFNDIMDLLRGSLLSTTPLTDLILHKSCSNHERRGSNVVTGDLVHQTAQKSSSDSKRMIVKAILRKSDNKLMCALANEDFVDFLFSLLVIPLGGVECLLGGKTPLKNIDNLYSSIAKDKYLSTPDMKNRLMKPELPPNYLSKNQIFSLEEQMTPKVYYFESVTTPDSTTTLETGSWMHFKDPKGTFTLANDLTVTRVDSVFSALNRLNINWSDIRELELHIGLEEALNILERSLTSTSALSDALINPTMRIATGVHAIV
ncbi:hypothetical protein PHJA_000099700 [Phtheirospermum japonicum]|uniref:DUF674 family protein n=1 Tax=Phtheirospermum japonicum TaxID=374723 RepID=A0A830B252_9LAMI|nr:hypothetical protein PHJA_000099700 [Phtheirospermum japonicum]